MAPLSPTQLDVFVCVHAHFTRVHCVNVFLTGSTESLLSPNWKWTESSSVSGGGYMSNDLMTSVCLVCCVCVCSHVLQSLWGPVWVTDFMKWGHFAESEDILSSHCKLKGLFEGLTCVWILSILLREVPHWVKRPESNLSATTIRAVWIL